MSAEVWTVVSAAIVILIAIAAANRALRREMSERFGEVNERFGEVDKRLGEVNERFDGVGERIAALRAEMIERFGELSERLGRVEGFLEGYALRKPAGRVRSGEHGPVLPQP